MSVSIQNKNSLAADAIADDDGPWNCRGNIICYEPTCVQSGMFVTMNVKLTFEWHQFLTIK